MIIVSDLLLFLRKLERPFPFLLRLFLFRGSWTLVVSTIVTMEIIQGFETLPARPAYKDFLLALMKPSTEGLPVMGCVRMLAFREFVRSFQEPPLIDENLTPDLGIRGHRTTTAAGAG